MHSLYDLYPDLQKQDKAAAIADLRAMLAWIERLPISKLPYVEMGFDALDAELIRKLQSHNTHVQSNFGTIDLKVQKLEIMKMHNLYQESFPFWSGPYLQQSTVQDFRVGNRVMNLNSTLRQYVPFGARGTIVGKTESKLIVMLDEQFLHGNDIFGHCQMYRGAQIEPNHLLNLSRAFARMMKENYQAARRFQEKPLEGCALFAQDQEEVATQVGGLTRREQHLQNKFNTPSTHTEKTEQKGFNQSKQQNQKEAAKQPEAKRAEKQPTAPQQKKAEKVEKKPQLVYQAKAQPQPEEERKGEEVASSTIPAAEPKEATKESKGGMFGAPLPGLKVLDPSLLTQPKF